MSNVAKPRYEFIDLMKGICITLVVLHHCRFHYIERYSILTTFRMPLYFILSGIFFKPYESIKAFILKKTNSLIIPLITTVLIYNIILNSFRYFSHSYSEFRLLSPSMWFLLCLFEVGIIYYCIKLIKNTIIETIVCYALSFCGFLLYYYQIHLPLFLDSSLSAIIFYHYGSILKNTGILNQQKTWISLTLLLMSIGIIAIVALFFDIDKLQLFRNRYPSNFIVTQILGLSGTLTVLYLSKIIVKIPIFSLFGRYSIIILCSHGIYVRVLRILFQKTNIPHAHAVMFICVLLLMFPTIYIVNKYVPFLFAQKSFFETIKSSQVIKKLTPKLAR